jgi:hypothetical protein
MAGPAIRLRLMTAAANSFAAMAHPAARQPFHCQRACPFWRII